MKQKEQEYEIIWITNESELNLNENLVKEFFSLYEDKSNFPDPEEREEPKYIIERIEEESNDPYTHLMAFNINKDGNSKFVAGCITEFYPDSHCVLVTYLFVNKDFRGIRIGTEQKKIGEILLKSQEGLKGLIDFFEVKYKKKPKAVLFESNNPYLTSVENDSMPPAKRLKFFKSLGAKKIDFDYIQPPLDADKGLVTNLYLLTFPDLANLGDSIDIKTILLFVMELTKSLDRNKLDNPESKYEQSNYQYDYSIVEKEKPINLEDLKGLEINGLNFIKKTCQNLEDKKMSNDESKVRLVEIPGVAV